MNPRKAAFKIAGQWFIRCYGPCGRYRAIEHFWKNRTNIWGVQTECRDCYRLRVVRRKGAGRPHEARGRLAPTLIRRIRKALSHAS